MKTQNNSILSLQYSDNQCNCESYKDGETLKSLWLSIPAYCHLKCPYCFASANEPGRKIESLTRSQYENIIREFASLGGEFIGIPGDGEPFHKSNWDLTKYIVSLCHELNIKLALFTTGDLIFFGQGGDESKIDYTKIDFIKDKDVVFLIKYNHSDEGTQNKLVGNKNLKYAWLREKALEILINKYHLNDERRRLGLVTSIMNENAVKKEKNGKLEIINIFERTQRDNLIFDCDTILELGRGMTFSKMDRQVPPKIDLENVFRELTEAGAIGLNQGGTYVGNTCCDRILHHLYIKANGDVFPCIGCAREDIESKMMLGNINSHSLKEQWDKELRRKLAEDRYNILVGVCASCENFQTEACYSCLGRCIISGDKAFSFNTDGLIETIRTIGCNHHIPSTTKWLATTIDYIRTVLSYPETTKYLKEKGLEYLWRPNKNLAYTLWQLEPEVRKQEIKNIIKHENNPQDDSSYKPYDAVYDSNVAKFSQKKHYRFSELRFPMNKVWDFVRDPYFLEDVETLDTKDKESFIDAVAQSFLSNIFLASFKILYQKYDKKEKNILYTNFILYDNIREKYFYRSMVNNRNDIENDKDQRYLKSLIISRWYENIKINGQEKNLWTDYCYNLSAHFRHEIYGDYELKLGNVKSLTPELEERTIDLTGILSLPEIKDKIAAFNCFIEKQYSNSVLEVLNSKIFKEFNETSDTHQVIFSFYNELSIASFYKLDDKLNKKLIEKLEREINSLYSNQSNPVLLKLKDEFFKAKKQGKVSQVINYFIYLGIMNEVLKVNYYYLLHSTNFASINPEANILLADSNVRGIIKSSGILICTKQPISENFRSELKIFISSIFAPFDEFYYSLNLREIEFLKESKFHQHTLNNIGPLINSYISFIKNDANKLSPIKEISEQKFEKLITDIEKLDVINQLYGVARKALIGIYSGLEHYSFFQIVKLITDYIKIYEIRINFKKNDRFDFNPDTSEESSKIFTILFNLFNNASKYSAKKEVKIKVYRTSDSKIAISITNQKEMEKKYVSFLTIEDTLTERNYSGLHVIKNLVKKLSWKISCCIENGNTTITLITNKNIM